MLGAATDQIFALFRTEAGKLFAPQGAVFIYLNRSLVIACLRVKHLGKINRSLSDRYLPTYVRRFCPLWWVAVTVAHNQSMFMLIWKCNPGGIFKILRGAIGLLLADFNYHPQKWWYFWGASATRCCIRGRKETKKFFIAQSKHFWLCATQLLWTKS